MMKKPMIMLVGPWQIRIHVLNATLAPLVLPKIASRVLLSPLKFSESHHMHGGASRKRNYFELGVEVC